MAWASSSSTAGRLRKLRDLEVYRRSEYYCGPGPSVVAFPDGELLVGFRRSPAAAPSHYFPETETCLTSSRDGGAHWSEPRVIEYGGVHNVNLTLLASGTLLYATAIAEQISRAAYERVKDLPENKGPSGRRSTAFSAEDMDPPERFRASPPGQLVPALGKEFCAMYKGVCVRRSTDRGRSWSPPFWVSPIPGAHPLLPGFPSPAQLRSPVVELRSGSLVFPIYTMGPSRIVLMGSADGGLTWSLVGTILDPAAAGLEHVNETVVHETPSGRLVALIRQTASGLLLTSRSADGGRTWDRPRQHQVWGYPFATLSMPSGRVLIAYGHRREPYGVRARLVDAELDQIDGADELILRDDGGTRDLGYPLCARMKDGTAIVTYYFNGKGDPGKRAYVAASVVGEA